MFTVGPGIVLIALHVWFDLIFAVVLSYRSFLISFMQIEQLASERLSNVPKITQLVNGASRMWTQVVLLIFDIPNYHTALTSYAG